MKKNLYMAPVMAIDHAEPQNMIAVSLDTSKVEWEDNVSLEVKNSSDWDNIW